MDNLDDMDCYSSDNEVIKSRSAPIKKLLSDQMKCDFRRKDVFTYVPYLMYAFICIKQY